MSSILCLTGWGQEYKSLEESLSFDIKSLFDINSLNYLNFNSFKELVTNIRHQDTLNPEILIGWSLGGQIAIRLIEAKIFTPKLLVLIAPPFQLVKDDKIHAGMSTKTFNEFYKNFSSAPDNTLKKFSILSLMNDKNKSQIIKNIKIDKNNSENLISWLEELKKFSCFNIDFTDMPSTLFFMGLGDMVVHFSQAGYFEKKIKNFELHGFSDCGHAPHLSDNAKFNEILLNKIKSLNI